MPPLASSSSSFSLKSYPLTSTGLHPFTLPLHTAHTHPPYLSHSHPPSFTYIHTHTERESRSGRRPMTRSASREARGASRWVFRGRREEGREGERREGRRFAFFPFLTFPSVVCTPAPRLETDSWPHPSLPPSLPPSLTPSLPPSVPPSLYMQAFARGFLPFSSAFPCTHHPKQQQEPQARQPFLLPFLPRARHTAEGEKEDDDNEEEQQQQQQWQEEGEVPIADSGR